jgi:hypothetical protein
MPQETNMAELLRLMQKMIVSFDDLNGKFDHLVSDVQVLKSDVQVLKSDVTELKTGLVRVEGKVDVLSGQFWDFAAKTMNNTQRITSLEGRVDILESKSN